MTEINQALRAHVTSAQFALVLGSTHIAALVQIDYHLRRNVSIDEDLKSNTIEDRDSPEKRNKDGQHYRAFRHNATGVNGLIRRGLVHHSPPSGESGHWSKTKPEAIWEITDAGRLVIGLLRESGLWEDFGGSGAAS